MNDCPIREFSICRGCDEPCIVINDRRECGYPQCEWRRIDRDGIRNVYHTEVSQIRRAFESIIKDMEMGDDTVSGNPLDYSIMD